MNLELIIVVLVFSWALFYISKRFYASFRSKNKCSGCPAMMSAKAKLPPTVK